MNDERMQSLLDRWYRDREVAPRDVREGVASVMANVPRTRQQGHPLPFRLVSGKPKTPTATDTTEYRPSPVPATNGHATTVIGRTRTMFSPAKAFIAGALVFALGGLFFVAQPSDKEGAGLPGAATDRVRATATAVTATQECLLGSVVRCTYTASDPRLTGRGSHDFTGSASETGSSSVNSGAVGAFWSDTRIEGPDGAWTGHHYIVTDSTGTAHALVMLAGEGAYDGWSFIASGTDPEADGDHELVGVIYQGPLPPVGPLPSTASE